MHGQKNAEGINRNIVECKDWEHNDRNLSEGVLIETLWNVKEAHTQDVEQRKSCINRNIVECKDKEMAEINKQIEEY